MFRVVVKSNVTRNMIIHLTHAIREALEVGASALRDQAQSNLAHATSLSA